MKWKNTEKIYNFSWPPLRRKCSWRWRQKSRKLRRKKRVSYLMRLSILRLLRRSCITRWKINGIRNSLNSYSKMAVPWSRRSAPSSQTTMGRSSNSGPLKTHSRKSLCRSVPLCRLTELILLLILRVSCLRCALPTLPGLPQKSTGRHLTACRCPSQTSLTPKSSYGKSITGGKMRIWLASSFTMKVGKKSVERRLLRNRREKRL